MEALPWTLRVTVSLPTNVPALGLKATVRESDWAAPTSPKRVGAKAEPAPPKRVGAKAEPAPPKRVGAKAGGDDSRLDEHVTRARTSTAWRARRLHALLAHDIRAIQSRGV